MEQFRFRQYQVVGRDLPTESDEHPKIYRVKLWYTNEVRVKSKFWYNNLVAYGQSKLANVLHTKELSLRFKACYLCHFYCSYCDCFVAGLYCADSCSCKGCFNRPEQKESVIESRQLIESRNPLAFAPRIMQHVANSPTNSGESCKPVALPSLRHKRGCNCRKSMCLKKDCECYEANVGCSDGCRCEGCKNVYGKKPGKNVYIMRLVIRC